MDKWLYPEDLDNENFVGNIVIEDNENYANFYKLPDNWRDIVTNNNGKDGKESIHDLIDKGNNNGKR